MPEEYFWYNTTLSIVLQKGSWGDSIDFGTVIMNSPNAKVVSTTIGHGQEHQIKNN